MAAKKEEYKKKTWKIPSSLLRYGSLIFRVLNQPVRAGMSLCLIIMSKKTQYKQGVFSYFCKRMSRASLKDCIGPQGSSLVLNPNRVLNQDPDSRIFLPEKLC